MTRTAAEQFISRLGEIGRNADLEHVCGDTYAVRLSDISLTIRTPNQARFVLKYIKPRDAATNE